MQAIWNPNSRNPRHRRIDPTFSSMRSSDCMVKVREQRDGCVTRGTEMHVGGRYSPRSFHDMITSLPHRIPSFRNEGIHDAACHSSFADRFLVSRKQVLCLPLAAQSRPLTEFAIIDGIGPDWKTLSGEDFEMVNGDEDTWRWEGTLVKCKGKPVGVTRSKKPTRILSLSLVAAPERWRQFRFFLWAPEALSKTSQEQTSRWRHRGTSARPRLHRKI